ncbi:MAG: hypothetical protein AABX11_02670 [Nanoarchaeota archaeon]
MAKLFLTHVVLSAPAGTYWTDVKFLTQEEGKPGYHVGRELNETIPEEEVRKTEGGRVWRLVAPVELGDNQNVWLAPNEDRYYVSEKAPTLRFGDEKPILALS